jgi:hypothetical protein
VKALTPLAYVDHHDKAYAWAERRRIEAHPTTGAVQIVVVRERVEEVAQPFGRASSAPYRTTDEATFGALTADDLLSVGVPTDWIDDVLAATIDSFLDLARHLPAEAAERLLEFSTSGRLPTP